jgi:molybdate transport system substrate-binding protein
VIRTILTAAAGAVLIGLASCGSPGGPTLTIAAASDLARAFDELIPVIAEACDIAVETVLGSSGQLRDQVRAGAPYDLYLSADRAYPRALEASGDIEPGSVRDYAVGRIVIAWRDGVAPVESLDQLIRADLTHIAIANPDHAPYGRAAREALAAAGLWETLRPRFVVGENIRQTTEYVRGGNADAGIVALSLVLDPAVPHTLIDDASHGPIVQSGGVSAHATHPEGARCALGALAGDEGQRILARFGFERVE